MLGVSVDTIILISTHALREEGDLFPVHIRQKPAISTHALREEGDLVGLKI